MGNVQINGRTLLERFYPILIGAICGYGAWNLFQNKPLPEKTYDMMANGINIGGIAVGFMATTIALVYTLQSSYIIAQLKKLGHFQTFLIYFNAALRWCIFLVVVGAVGFFLDFKGQGNPPKVELFPRIFFSIWACVFITAGLSAIRFIRILFKILHDESVE
jgi:hypothetical protein